MAPQIRINVTFLTTAYEAAIKEGLTQSDISAIAYELANDPLKGSLSVNPPIMEFQWNARLNVSYVFSGSQFQIFVIAICRVNSPNSKGHPADKEEVKALLKKLLKKGVIGLVLSNLDEVLDLPEDLIEVVKRIFTRD